MSAPLEDVAAEADAAADDERQLARRARAMQRQRDRGRSWLEILEGESAAIEVARRGARRAAKVATNLAGTIVRGLSREGQSRRKIAQRLGVSHQRVTAMLNGRRSDLREEW